MPFELGLSGGRDRRRSGDLTLFREEFQPFRVLPVLREGLTYRVHGPCDLGGWNKNEGSWQIRVECPVDLVSSRNNPNLEQELPWDRHIPGFLDRARSIKHIYLRIHPARIVL
jgi:hypothetical protein